MRSPSRLAAFAAGAVLLNPNGILAVYIAATGRE